jgi:predicted membrane chloride channel (bestrophin family)
MANFAIFVISNVAMPFFGIEIFVQAYSRVSENLYTSEFDKQLPKATALRQLLFSANPVVARAPHSRPLRSGHTKLQVDLPSPQIELTQGSDYAETIRPNRRDVYMHKEWVKHRSSSRFFDNLNTLPRVQSEWAQELSVVLGVASFAVVINLILVSWQGIGGASHPGLLPAVFGMDVGLISIPNMPYSISLPALSLLLTFRANQAYSRWNEARTLWGGVINNCRNVVRQANLFMPGDSKHKELKDQMAANTAGFCKALRNFLRGPEDDETFRSELQEMADAGLIPAHQVDRCMAAKNRPMFMLNAISDSLSRADIGTIEKQAIDRSIGILVDLTGACERIFKSPIPLVLTRHTNRFLSLFLLLLPFGLIKADTTWNHILTIPMTDVIAFFLVGIEELGIQLEEPFSVLPLEAFCDGAISATLGELLDQTENRVFDFAK